MPEDFPLPEGYVRHYQATDDGEPLPAILMFHPDFEWLDENGNQIPLPDGPDRPAGDGAARHAEGADRDPSLESRGAGARRRR